MLQLPVISILSLPVLLSTTEDWWVPENGQHLSLVRCRPVMPCMVEKGYSSSVFEK